MTMKMPVAIGCVALALGAVYTVAVYTHVLKPIDLVAVLHIRPADRLYHGSAVNLAKEERRDKYWQRAFSESQKVCARLASHHAQPGALAQAEFPGRIQRGSPAIHEIALTFDDGPHLQTAQALVNELKSLNLKATFFVVGKMAEKYPQLVRAEALGGNEIANHSFSHVNLSKIPEREIVTEYRACNLLLKDILGYSPRFCRPPGGNSDPLVFEGAEANNMSTVLWTDDPMDYSNPGEDVILERSLKKLSNGGILLLHEGVRETMNVLPLLTKEIRDRGYNIVTVGQLIRDSALRRQGAVAQIAARRHNPEVRELVRN